MLSRQSGRLFHELRPVSFETPASLHAEGSCLVAFGHTRVLCTASLEERVPPFLKNTGTGWVTAEYGMLPRATQTRNDREAARGKQTGRTHEIQRLIGRSLRAIVDGRALGERQIKIDCDVLQADGGTRTAAITGAYVALYQACQSLVTQKLIKTMPLTSSVAALSCGLNQGQALLDLDYSEDSTAEVDANFVITGAGNLVEIQACGEQRAFTRQEFDTLLSLAEQGAAHLAQLQRQALSGI